MLSKTCNRCSQVKPVDAFYKSAATKWRPSSSCIECTKEAVRQNRLAKIDYYRSHDRKRGGLAHRVEARAKYAKTPEAKIAFARAKAKWSVTNAIKRKASFALNNAIRDGKITPLPCFVCGQKAHGHHPDYSAPLAVSWLCPKHHSQTHKEHREWVRQES